jgi:hypothetical protein
MNRTAFWLALCLPLCAAALVHGSLIITPLSTFGGGDGWLAPGEAGYTYLGTASLERGLAYGNGHLYLVSRNGGNFIRILSATTGADLGALSVTGITGGTFAVNCAATDADGAIYVCNLSAATSAAAPFKIYKWTTEAATPTVAFTGLTITGARVGDDLAAIGSGSLARLASGFSGSPAVAGNNGFALINPSANTSTNVALATAPPDPGDFRLGLTFLDDSHVIGSQGHNIYRYTSFAGSTGTLLASPTLVPGERLLAYTTISNTHLLATLNTADAGVNIYDVADPALPVLLGTANATSGLLATNSNFTGQLAWGDITGASATLYAMSTNQGIQAFTVTLPEPATGAVLLTLLALLSPRHRRRN